MPSVEKSDKWLVMCDGAKEFIFDKVKNVMFQWIDLEQGLAVYHEGKTKENPHFHAIIRLRNELQKQSLNARLKTLFGVKKGQFSSQVWDGNDIDCGAGTYMFHEENAEVIQSKNYTANQIESLRQKGREVAKVVDENKKRAEGRIPQRVLQKIRESESNWTKHQICEEILLMVRRGECYMPKGDFQLKGYIEEIYLKQLDKDVDVDKYVEDTMRRLYRFD